VADDYGASANRANTTTARRKDKINQLIRANQRSIEQLRVLRRAVTVHLPRANGCLFWSRRRGKGT
jgi:hypothetical protein